MFSKLLKGSLGTLAMILVIGIISAPLVGSEKAFELGPFLTFTKNAWNWITDSAEAAKQPEENPEPFSQIATRTINQATSALDKGANTLEMPAPVSPSPTSPTSPEIVRESSTTTAQPHSTDLRLSICPTGSVEPRNQKEVSSAIIQSLEAQPDIRTFLDIQAFLGEPVCIIKSNGRTQWRYLGEDGATIDVTQSDDEKDPVEVRVTKF